MVFFVVSHPRVHVSAAGMLADEWGAGRGSINFPITSGTEMLVELLMISLVLHAGLGTHDGAGDL